SAPPALHTLSLHDALPISSATRSLGIFRRSSDLAHTIQCAKSVGFARRAVLVITPLAIDQKAILVRAGLKRNDRFPGAIGLLFRSEEHTSELQSLTNLVCR